jgi:RNA polymerase subunit RPABC4/transcription elongation factor Spt4
MNGKEQRFGAGVSSAWNERMRLIRLRRKKEHSTFRNELKVVPKWLWVTLIVIFLIAQVFALIINAAGVANGGHMWPDGFSPLLAMLTLAAAITGGALATFPWILLLGYVNRDAKRRGMNSTLWTLLCLVLFPAYFAVGFIIYFLVREPLPYACAKCATMVGPRFNFCPNCKNDLHPSCPNCKREIVETDRFCPYCAHELGTAVEAESAAARNP